MEEVATAIERAYLENEIFDLVKHWQEYHPRTFWPTIETLSSFLAEKLDKDRATVGEFVRNTAYENVGYPNRGVHMDELAKRIAAGEHTKPPKEDPLVCMECVFNQHYRCVRRDIQSGKSCQCRRCWPEYKHERDG